ncbi:Teneurin-3, partial [Xenoophorus captivus]
HQSFECLSRLSPWCFFSDGLVDCMDPDCCSQISCQGQTYCRGSADPAAVAGQGQSAAAQPSSKSFYDRVSFLIGPSGSHVIPGDNPFNSR